MTTISPTARQKIAESFDLFDTNHDGTLTKDDFTRYADNLARAFGRDPQSPPARNLKQTTEELWQKLQVSTGGKQSVSREEFLQYHERTQSQEPEILQYADAIFELADADGNDRLSRDEFARVQQARGEKNPAFVDDAFATYDADGDGALTKSEFIEYIRDFIG
ncbi:EF-hand domain-containing protein [Actinosynnema sp. NPDC020468]|uniref:EF-hand domain-containing protein n=1 Tax=Actinosynnema sp. NPDC020468 TaxID=3154488 RepID=UPI0033EB532B